MAGYAWVTLATNDAYSLGALVLAHSLRRVGTKYELAVLVTPGVTDMMREKLAAVFNLVQEVNVLDSKDQANLALLARPELGITFTKLHCWRLTQYEKCVFVDADTLVVRNCDELFEREELSAAPDVGWPDCFNSGVFVFKPSQQTFASITAFAASKGSFDGGDQGLLNMYFEDWAHKDISKHLPFIYNMCSTATYSYLPAFKQFGEDVRIIHFIGITKPWLQYFDTMTGIVQPPMGSTHLQPLLQLWWNIFCDSVHPQLSSAMATSTLAPIWHKFSRPEPPNQSLPYHPSAPRSPLHYDANNENYERYSDIYIEAPDFSEFKDPWEHYSPRDDPFINDVRQNGSSEWSTYTSNTDYSPKPPNGYQQYQQHSQSINRAYNRVYNVQEAIEYHARLSPPQRRQSHSTNFGHKGQQTDLCFLLDNGGQGPQSRYERRKSEVCVERPNEQQEYEDGNRHDLAAYEHHRQREYPKHHEQHYHNQEQYDKQQEDDQCQHCGQRDHHQRHQEQNEEYHQHRHDQHRIHQDHHDVGHQDHHQDQQHHHVHHQDQSQDQQYHHVHHQDHSQDHQQHHHYDNHQGQQHNHVHHQDQHHYHHNHGSKHPDHQLHQQFIESITNHEEHKQDIFSHHREHKNNEDHGHYTPEYDQQSQRMDSKDDNNEHYCQTPSENTVYHNNEQSQEASQHVHRHFIVDQPTDIQITESHPPSKPCTDLHNVATQSDPNITGDSSNAGLPGALAQMTLGQPRSAEQIALEEHMRKQSWEQGQIDYMGRDSFDNIWKKICLTLSLAPQRQPTPPKEIPKTEEPTADSKVCPISIDETDAPAKTAKEATDSTEQIQTCKVLTTESIAPPARAIDKEAAEPPTTEQDIKDKLETTTAKQETLIDSKKCETCPTHTPLTSEPTAPTPTTPICQISGTPVCPLMLLAKKEDTKIQETELAESDQDKPIVCALSKQAQTQLQARTKEESTFEGKETKTCESSTATEATSPVPIQVAESVLQAEPKESVSEEPRPITEEIVSSVEVPVQESVAALSVKPMEPITNSATCILRQGKAIGQANGSLSTNALAKLQSADMVTSPTTVCQIPPKPDAENVEKCVNEGVVSTGGAADSKSEVLGASETPAAELSKSVTEVGTAAGIMGTTTEVEEEVTKCKMPKVETGGEVVIKSMSKTEAVVADLPKSDVANTEMMTSVAVVPKCELSKSKITARETPVMEIPKHEASEAKATATATPVTEPLKFELPKAKTMPETPVTELPKSEPLKSETTLTTTIVETARCELPKSKVTSETSGTVHPQSEPLKSETTATTPVAETPKGDLPKIKTTSETPTMDLLQPESLKSETLPATPIPETQKSEPSKTETAVSLGAEVAKCELPKAKSKQETPAAEPLTTEPLTMPIAEPLKCELLPTKPMSEALLTETSKSELAKIETAPQTPTLEPPEAAAPVTESLKSEAAAVTPSPETGILEPTPVTVSKPPSTKAQDAPKPDPLKMPPPAAETPALDTSKPTTPKTPESPSDTPVRPTRTKEFNIPPTPTVTEATPPTSPPIGADPLDLESQAKTKKTTKKVLKKSASECESGDGAEGDGEKKTKKSVKKVATKKAKESQEEGGAEASGTEKSKKTAKVVKKMTKPSPMLGADPSVPETPPPGSADAPIPPKRKIKGATTGKSTTSTKKPDEP